MGQPGTVVISCPGQMSDHKFARQERKDETYLRLPSSPALHAAQRLDPTWTRHQGSHKWQWDREGWGQGWRGRPYWWKEGVEGWIWECDRRRHRQISLDVTAEQNTSILGNSGRWLHKIIGETCGNEVHCHIPVARHRFPMIWRTFFILCLYMFGPSLLSMWLDITGRIYDHVTVIHVILEAVQDASRCFCQDTAMHSIHHAQHYTARSCIAMHSSVQPGLTHHSNSFTQHCTALHSILLF